MSSTNEVNVILRPRRLGKSTNLNMLHSFLSLRIPSEGSSTKAFFESCSVGKDKDSLLRNFRKYSGIFLSLKDCAACSWQTMRLWRCIRQMFLPHLAQLSGLAQLQEFNFRSLIAPGCELMELEGSLALLTECLFQQRL